MQTQSHAASSSSSQAKGQADITKPKWKELIGQMQVREVAAELKDQATALGSSIVTVSKDDTVVHVLHVLTENRISSAPVYDRQASSFIGLIDVLDLVAYFYQSVNFICSGGKADRTESEILANENWADAEKLIDEADEETLEKIKSATVDSMMGMSERTQWRSVTLDAPLGVLLELLADKDTHRIPITNNEGTALLGIVTQFDVARWIHAKVTGKTWIQPMVSCQTTEPVETDVGKLTVDEFQRKKPSTPQRPKSLITVLMTDPMLKALMCIHKHKVMGVAAVDESGKLLANISANDLRKLPDHDFKQFLKDLFTPVREFHEPWRLVTCKGGDNIEQVLEKMIAHNVHRVWIVDAENKPQGVISLCDIIGEFCSATGYCA